MNRTLTLVISSMLLVGCAGLNQTRAILEEAESQKATYFSNPKDKLMVLIETVDGSIPYADCTTSWDSLSAQGSNSNSFSIMRPYIRIFDYAEVKAPARQYFTSTKYTELSETDKAYVKLHWKQRMALSVPQVVYVCQPDINYGAGLSGKIYFDGKVVSSDRNPSGYGVISLRYSMPTEALLPP